MCRICSVCSVHHPATPPIPRPRSPPALPHYRDYLRSLSTWFGTQLSNHKSYTREKKRKEEKREKARPPLPDGHVGFPRVVLPVRSAAVIAPLPPAAPKSTGCLRRADAPSPGGAQATATPVLCSVGPRPASW